MLLEITTLPVKFLAMFTAAQTAQNKDEIDVMDAPALEELKARWDGASGNLV